MNHEATSAVTFTAHGKAELLPAARDSSLLAADEIAGRTIATLISAGTELSGRYLPESGFPCVPGYAAVFEVEQTGAAVHGFHAKDLAFCTGSHRSFQRVNASDALLVPASLSPTEAVFARMMGVSMATLTTTAARPPQRVLVTGLGVVGHLAALIFTQCGYVVIACDPMEERRKMAQFAGIKPVLPAVPVDDASVAGTISLALECSGHEDAAFDCCRVVRKRGEVVLIGVPWQKRSDRAAFDLLHAVFHRYIVLRSGWEGELPRHGADFQPNSQTANWRAALHWLAEGRIEVNKLYATAPPRDAQRVYQDLLHHHWSHLAAIFDWTR